MIGIDVVSINRIEKTLNKFGNKFLEKFLSKDEILLAKKPSTIAGFWASKEAASKALKTGIGKEVGFLDIKISKLPSGAPVLEFSSSVKKRFNIKEQAVSITHDNGLAIAVVVVSIEK
jgi:holo-[acyl-carrier protein] synthase